MDKVCYLGSTVTSSGSLDAEVMQHFEKGKCGLQPTDKETLKRPRRPPLHQDCRIQSCGPVHASVLLEDMDHLHIQQLEQFHQRCLRKICNTKWQDRVSSLQVLEKCRLPCIECLIIKNCLNGERQVFQRCCCRDR